MTAELAAYKAAAIGDSEIQRVVVEYRSGPQGEAAVNARVVEANAMLAETLCDCAVCEEAATRIRGRSKLAQEYPSGADAVAHVVERQAAETGCSGAAAANGLQQSKTEAQLPTRQQRQRERKKANKKKKKKKKM